MMANSAIKMDRKSNIIIEGYFPDEELTRHAFMSHMGAFIKQLLTTPKTARVDEFLLKHGISTQKAIEMLLTPVIDLNGDKESCRSVLKRKESIKMGEDGKDQFIVAYKLPRKDYKKKMRHLFINTFEKCIINENAVYPRVFKDENKMIDDVKAMDTDNTYLNRGGLNEDGSISRRVLTWKSKLGFGKWKDLPIENLYNAGQGHYLIWVYYNMSTIDFIQEIKDVLGIKDIEKPGTNKELGQQVEYQFKHELYSKMSDDERIKASAVAKAEKEIEQKNKRRIHRFDYSKAKMAWKNQGHLNEDEGGAACGGEGGGATNASSSGQYVTQLFGHPIKRKTIYMDEQQVEIVKKAIKEETVMNTMAGNFGFDAPALSTSKDDPSMNHDAILADDDFMKGMYENKKLGCRKKC